MRWVLAVLTVVSACGDDTVHHLPDAPPEPDAAEPCIPGGGVCCAATDCTGAGFACVERACVDVAGSLSGLVWKLPCEGGNPNDPTTCRTTPKTVSTTVGGTAGVTYDITVHLRGVFEQK